MQWFNCSFGTFLANMVSLGVNSCLSTASYGVDSSGRYSIENRQTKQIENICKEHVPNVILELSGKIR